MAHHSAIYENTGCMPNQLMLGRDVKILVDLIIGAPPVRVTPPDYNKYAWNLREQLGTEHYLDYDHLNIESQQ